MNRLLNVLGARMDRMGRRRLVALFALLTLAPLILLTFFSVRMAGDAVHRQLIARTETTAHVAAALISQQMQGLKGLVESYAKRRLLAQALRVKDRARQRKEIRYHVEQLKNGAPGIGTAFVTDAEGNLLTIYPKTPSIVGQNFAFRDWYQGVTASNDTYVSRVYTSAAAGNPEVVAAATPIKDTLGPRAKGETVGIIVAAFTTDTIQRFAEGIQAADGVRLTIADQSGTVVAGMNQASSDARTDHRISTALEGLSGVDVHDANHDHSAEGTLSAFAPIPNIGWALVAEVPENDTLAAISTLRSTVFTIAGVLALALLAGLGLLTLALRERDRVEQERQRTQDELVLARQRAMEASRLKSEFLANMSHEIRTPMNGVMGMAALLAGTELTKEQQEYADTIYRSGDALLTIINDILDFSKVEAGKLEIESVDFEIRTVVEEVAELLSGAAHAKGLELINLIRPNVPEMVKGDPGRLRQILMNLVGNAIKFTDSGEVITSVSVIDSDDDRVTCRFEVADTGIGIAPEHKARLFDSFSQVDASTTRIYGGTGLGLAVSQQLISLMGGRIDVESEPGKGSTFWFEITLDRSSEQPRPIVIEYSGIRGLKVLVVDDNETNRLVFGESLRNWGMDPTCVADGWTAISVARAAAEEGRPFQVALLDFHMPGMDGLELAATLSKDPQLQGIKPLLLTSSAYKHDLMVASEAGIHAYLQKPVKQSALYDTIAAVVGDGSPTTRRQMVTGYTLAERKSSARRRILVAEDNLVNQKVAARMLEKLGHRVDIAANGREAVAAVDAIDYDVVLMDCQMPEMDGYEATIEIRKSQRGKKRTPIIAMTASAMKADEDKALAAGMDAYISKPVKIEDLAAILDGTLATEGSTSGETAGSDERDAQASDAPLDPKVIASLKALDGGTNEGFFATFITTFLESAAARLDELDRGLADDDWQTKIARLAHTLKGSCGSAGATVCTSKCRRLEDAVATGDRDQAQTLAAELRVEIERVRAELTRQGLIEGQKGHGRVA